MTQYEIYDDTKFASNRYSVSPKLADHVSRANVVDEIKAIFAKANEHAEEAKEEPKEVFQNDGFDNSVPAIDPYMNSRMLPSSVDYTTSITTPDAPITIQTLPEKSYEGARKNGNPKTSVGSRKFSPSVMSAAVTAEIAVGMFEGARKYGRHNWRDEGAMASIYWDAACRHLFKWWEGEDIDPDSGLSHIVKAMASLYVLRDAMIHGNFVDDRPPQLPEGWYDELDKVAAEIIDRYPDARPPHLNKKGEDNA